MFPDTIVTLGDFDFFKFEIPEKISFGGEQRLVTHELVGGQRVVDCMGPSHAPLEWSGMFTGEAALERARYLDGLRITGQEQVLSWSELRYLVVVGSFKADFSRYYEIPYHISCTVVQDLSGIVDYIAYPGIDDLVAGDMALANLLGALIGDGALSDMLYTLGAAVKTVSSFARSTQGVINSVLMPLAACRVQVGSLAGVANATLGSVSAIGGVMPGASLLLQQSNLATQTSAMQRLPNLYNLSAVLGRMDKNIGTLRNGKTITVAGGNLFDLAADNYGDASEWTTIARANGLVDPQLLGINTLFIPAARDGAGGVLNA